MTGALRQALIDQFKLPRGVPGALAGHMMARKNRKRIQWAVSEMGVKPGERVLEVGHGPGTAIAEIFKLEPRCRVVGIDPSSVMHAQAQRKNHQKMEAGQLDLLTVAAEDYDGRGGPFDLVFAINVLPFCRNPAGRVGDFASWLNPGGRIVIGHQIPLKSVDNSEIDAREQEFSSWLKLAGLHVSRKLRLPETPNPVLFIEGI